MRINLCLVGSLQKSCHGKKVSAATGESARLAATDFHNYLAGGEPWGRGVRRVVQICAEPAGQDQSALEKAPIRRAGGDDMCLPRHFSAMSPLSVRSIVRQCSTLEYLRRISTPSLKERLDAQPLVS